MLEKYGLQSSVASGNYNIAREPLYFVRSGLVGLDYGSLRHSGRIGYDWSRSAVAYSSASSASSYWFEFTASESRPSTGPYDRYHGCPVRCLVILV